MQVLTYKIQEKDSITRSIRCATCLFRRINLDSHSIKCEICPNREIKPWGICREWERAVSSWEEEIINKWEGRKTNEEL